MRELNDAIVSSRKIKFEEFKEEDHKTTSVSSSEEEDQSSKQNQVIKFIYLFCWLCIQFFGFNVWYLWLTSVKANGEWCKAAGDSV